MKDGMDVYTGGSETMRDSPDVLPPHRVPHVRVKLTELHQLGDSFGAFGFSRLINIAVQQGAASVPVSAQKLRTRCEQVLSYVQYFRPDGSARLQWQPPDAAEKALIKLAKRLRYKAAIALGVPQPNAQAEQNAPDWQADLVRPVRRRPPSQRLPAGSPYSEWRKRR